MQQPQNQQPGQFLTGFDSPLNDPHAESVFLMIPNPSSWDRLTEMRQWRDFSFTDEPTHALTRRKTPSCKWNTQNRTTLAAAYHFITKLHSSHVPRILIIHKRTQRETVHQFYCSNYTTVHKKSSQTHTSTQTLRPWASVINVIHQLVFATCW